MSDTSVVTLDPRRAVRVDARLDRLVERALNGLNGVDDRVEALLHLGSRIFHTPIAILSWIQGDSYHVLQAWAPDHDLAPGTVFPLGDTYCSVMLDAGGPCAVSHVARSPWQSHPCYLKMHLECYLGVPVELGGGRRGTLNFSGPRPSPVAFDRYHVEWLERLGDWVERVYEEPRQTAGGPLPIGSVCRAVASELR